MLFWKSNPEIALTVLYFDIDVKIFCVEDEICPHVYKSTKQSYVSKHYYERKKTFLLLIPDGISVEEHLSKTMTEECANFYDDKNIENNLLLVMMALVSVTTMP